MCNYRFPFEILLMLSWRWSNLTHVLYLTSVVDGLSVQDVTMAMFPDHNCLQPPINSLCGGLHHVVYVLQLPSLPCVLYLVSSTCLRKCTPGVSIIIIGCRQEFEPDVLS
jgi:hypothetical protein